MTDRAKPVGWQYHTEQLTLTDKWSPKKPAAELQAFTTRLKWLVRGLAIDRRRVPAIPGPSADR